MKLTVSEYSTQFKTSVQSVYQRIKRGTLKSIEENGIKYVLIEDESIKPSLNNTIENGCKDLLKLIKSQQKEIKRLTKELTKAQNDKSNVLEKFIFEMQRLAAPLHQEQDEEIIEVKGKKKKNRKKDKKKKK